MANLLVRCIIDIKEEWHPDVYTIHRAAVKYRQGSLFQAKFSGGQIASRTLIISGNHVQGLKINS